MKTILVVDDEFANAEALSMILSEEGYRVVCASNGQQGLAKVEEEAPDLILLDFMMPIMNGPDMGRAVRALPAFARTRIILQSGLSEETARAHWDGYDAYLRKPFEIDELLALVSACLEAPVAKGREGPASAG